MSQVQLMLRKVRPEWTADNFKTVCFTTHGDKQKEGQLLELGQGAFTGEQLLDQPCTGGSSSTAKLPVLAAASNPATATGPLLLALACVSSSSWLLIVLLAEVIDRAVADGSIDIGVHSLKDTPITLPDGVDLAACLPRDDPR
jgi:porphobilinogen deaminase